mmetsp:Transcript_31667/g.81135  ORF Transcript_31667/g.81135 Transcript_31667/m.81135 type:complete len:229 (-) Transcript_31667:127-813(-)
MWPRGATSTTAFRWSRSISDTADTGWEPTCRMPSRRSALPGICSCVAYWFSTLAAHTLVVTSTCVPGSSSSSLDASWRSVTFPAAREVRWNCSCMASVARDTASACCTAHGCRATSSGAPSWTSNMAPAPVATSYCRPSRMWDEETRPPWGSGSHPRTSAASRLRSARARSARFRASSLSLSGLPARTSFICALGATMRTCFQPGRTASIPAARSIAPLEFGTGVMAR